MNVNVGNSPSNPFNIIFHGSVDPRQSRAWCVQDLIPQVGTGLLAGQWGTFKTSVAMELAHAIMVPAGEFLGHPVIRRGGILFFALEGQSEVAVRIQGFIEERRKSAGPQPFAWVYQCPQLLGPKSAGEIVAYARWTEEHLRERFDLPLSMIIIDTMVTAAGFYKEGMESDAATTQAIMSTLQLVADELGCFVLAIDHFGKDPHTGTRGSSAKEAAADIVLATLADRNTNGGTANHRVVIRKSRCAPAGGEFAFRPRIIDMGPDEAGRSITSVVLDWDAAEMPSPLKVQKPPKPSLRLFLRILDTFLADSGTDIIPFAGGPSVKAVDVEAVREEFRRQNPDVAEKSKDRAWQRAINLAIAENIVASREFSNVQWLWRVAQSSGDSDRPL